MDVRGIVAKLKNMEAVANPLTTLPRLRGELVFSAVMRMTLGRGEGKHLGKLRGLDGKSCPPWEPKGDSTTAQGG